MDTIYVAGTGTCDQKAIGVIVLTRGRIAWLDRALRSLASQHAAVLDVLLVIDDCSATASHIRRISIQTGGAIHRLRVLMASRRPEETSGPRRVAYLRRAAVAEIETPWVAFLDDDNTVTPDHFSSLQDLAIDHAACAVHSWRTLWTRNSQPFKLIDKHPWSRDAVTARSLFDMYRKAGIYTPNSNLVRDQVVTGSRHKSMVDTSEWLFFTSFLQTLEFCEEYSASDWLNACAEDSKLLDQVVARKMHVPCSRRATLKYVLGGYSNAFDQDGSSLEDWHVAVG